MTDANSLTGNQMRRQRKRMAAIWLVCLLISIAMLKYQVIGVVIPSFLAAGCVYLVVINLFLAFSGQSSIRDMSDLSPKHQQRQHYAEDDEKPWKF